MEQNMYKNESFEEDGPGATVFFSNNASLLNTKRKLEFIIS